MRLELNEQSYLLSFNPDEGRWYVVTPGAGGLKALPVINDDDVGVTTADVLVPLVDVGSMSIGGSEQG